MNSTFAPNTILCFCNVRKEQGRVLKALYTHHREANYNHTQRRTTGAEWKQFHTCCFVFFALLPKNIFVSQWEASNCLLKIKTFLGEIAETDLWTQQETGHKCLKSNLNAVKDSDSRAPVLYAEFNQKQMFRIYIPGFPHSISCEQQKQYFHWK